jgi:Nucleotidyl transferase AbiEii toxin, Type IV TA system
MTEGEGSPYPGVDSAARLPAHLRRVLPADTANAWQALAPHLPQELYLGGGTGVAVHLGHRTSRDLDLFFHRPVDLGKLGRLLGDLGPFAVTHESDGTLRGLFSGTKVEIFDASDLQLLVEPEVVAGIRVADLHDLMAMKLKVLAERGEMRDYFDVKAIDELGSVSVEEGVELYMRRYGIAPTSEALPHLYRALGDLGDVEVDEMLPVDIADLQQWWSRRQVQLLRNSDRFG